MATRPKGYGLTRETSLKIANKYDPCLEEDALSWIEDVLNEPALFEGIEGAQAVKEILKDGKILCRLMLKLEPGCIKKINNQKQPFFKMENIGKFLDAATAYGTNPNDLFQTVDLYDGQNMSQVIMGIHALGRATRKHIDYDGPILGPKESNYNPREFSEEQLRAGESVIGLQMGSNKGATQAGMIMGKTRAVLD